MRKVFLRIHRYQFHKLTKFIIGRQNSYILICILFDLVFLYIYAFSCQHALPVKEDILRWIFRTNFYNRTSHNSDSLQWLNI